MKIMLTNKMSYAFIHIKEDKAMKDHFDKEMLDNINQEI